MMARRQWSSLSLYSNCKLSVRVMQTGMMYNEASDSEPPQQWHQQG